MPRPSTRGLSSLSNRVLEMELRRRDRGVKRLQRQRARLLARLNALEAQIGQYGGNGVSRGGGRTRPRNEMSLEDALAKLLAGKTMSVTEATEAVQRAGYRTGAENFRTIVNQRLISSGKFKKVSRGQYTTK